MKRVQYLYPRNIRYHRTKCSRPGVLAPGIGHPWLKPLSAGNGCKADASFENVERGDHDKPSLFRHVKAQRDISKTFGLHGTADQDIPSPYRQFSFQYYPS